MLELQFINDLLKSNNFNDDDIIFTNLLFIYINPVNISIVEPVNVVLIASG